MNRGVEPRSRAGCSDLSGLGVGGRSDGGRPDGRHVQLLNLKDAITSDYREFDERGAIGKSRLERKYPNVSIRSDGVTGERRVIH